MRNKFRHNFVFKSSVRYSVKSGAKKTYKIIGASVFGLVFVGFAGFFLLSNTNERVRAIEPDGFACDGTFYQSRYDAAGSGTKIFRIDRSSVPYTGTPIIDVSASPKNGFAYNPVNGYFYLWNNLNSFYRINNAGTITTHATTTSVVAAPTAAVIDANGIYYSGTNQSSGYSYDTIDTNGTAPFTIVNHPLTPLGDLVGTNMAAPGDFVIDPRDTTKIYTTINQNLYIIDLTASTIARIGAVGALGAGFGSLFIDPSGALYGYANSTGFYQINKTTGTATLINTSEAIAASDGASCSFPDVSIDTVKTAGTVQRLTPVSFRIPYTVRVGNTSGNGNSIPNVQVTEALSRTFAAGSPTIAITTAPAVGAGPCVVNGSFNGVSNTRLLTGSTTLADGQACTITFTVDITYASRANIPTSAQNNTVYASSTSMTNNPGYTFNTSGQPTPPIQLITADESTDSSNLPGSSHGDTPSPTPVTLTNPGTPFTCSVSRSFLSFTNGTAPVLNTQLVEQTFDSNGEPVFGNIGSPFTANAGYNAIGYNAVDNFMYGLLRYDGATENHLIRISANGTVEDMGAITGATLSTFYQSGAMDNSNNLYVAAGSTSTVRIIQIDTTTGFATAVTLSQSAGAIGDLIYIDGYLWTINNAGGAVRINPTTGQTDIFTQTAVPAATTAWMGIWHYGDGSIGIIERGTGQYVRFRITNPASATPTFTRVAQAVGQAAGNGDATSCISPPTDLGITASAPATVAASSTFAIEYVVTNHGPSDSSGFVVTQTLPSTFSSYTVSTPGCSIMGQQLQCIVGPLDTGDTFDIDLAAQAPATGGTCGINGATVTANEQDTNAANNYAEAPTCVAVTSGLVVQKSANPSATVLDQGDEIIYSITAQNTGNTNLTTTVSDNLSQVLNNASVVTGSLAAASSVGGNTPPLPVRTGNTLNWNGTIAPGETITITYRVTVNSTAFGVTIRNAVTASGQTPGGTTVNSGCVTGTEAGCFTTNTTDGATNSFTVQKSVNPASGTTVNQNEVLSYSVLVNNTGQQAITPTVTDNLSQVLNNSQIVAGSLAATSSVGGNTPPVPTISGTTLSWSAAVAPNETITLTYQVRVNSTAYAVTLANHVTATAQPPTGGPINSNCVTGNEANCTTTNPTDAANNSLVVQKVAAPASGVELNQGDILAYTVTIRNTGEQTLSASATDTLTNVLNNAALQNGSLTATSSIPGNTPSSPSMSGNTLSWNGSVAPNEVITVRYSVIIDSDAYGVTLNNRVVASGTAPGGVAVPSNCTTGLEANCRTTHTTDTAVNSLNVQKTASPASGSVIPQGGTISYTITIANTGEQALATATDNLLSVLASAAVSSGSLSATSSIPGNTPSSPSISGNNLIWNGTVASGETITITYQVTVNDDAYSAEIENNVSVSGVPDGGGIVDSNCKTGGEASCSTQHTTHPILDLSITANGPAEVAPNENFGWTYRVRNNGPVHSTGSIVRQQLPAGITNAQVLTPGCSITGNELQCVLGALNIGDTFDIQLRGNAPNSAQACVVNDPGVSGNEPETTLDNNTAELTTCVKGVSAPAAPNTGFTIPVVASYFMGGIVVLFGSAILYTRHIKS